MPRLRSDGSFTRSMSSVSRCRWWAPWVSAGGQGQIGPAARSLRCSIKADLRRVSRCVFALSSSRRLRQPLECRLWRRPASGQSPASRQGVAAQSRTVRGGRGRVRRWTWRKSSTQRCACQREAFGGRSAFQRISRFKRSASSDYGSLRLIRVTRAPSTERRHLQTTVIAGHRPQTATAPPNIPHQRERAARCFWRRANSSANEIGSLMLTMCPLMPPGSCGRCRPRNGF